MNSLFFGSPLDVCDQSFDRFFVWGIGTKNSCYTKSVFNSVINS
ncbi:hypothetical protein N44_01554 [Microcystis aeruginosa NIES-44]|uniref:Uncharacterized protein n=1 Tax=Microcystis aeruginosa NIES-44 TaxID=449439 RepID=A0A0A1VQJ5_MICAE|nr:hypothetical protein N44_01554 [Microcystis aeruginosa NIES-44]